MAAGIVSLLVWFGLFAAGMTIDSAPYRAVLAPSAVTEGGAPQHGAVAASAAGGSPEVTTRMSAWRAFVGTMAFYTPLNVALLTILAGLIGGCASSVTYMRTRGAAATLPSEIRITDARAIFLSENPVGSMLRSLLVYLAFIAGVFITTNDPFGDPTPDQYVRLAGTLSFFSFVVGYDPTRFQDILSLKPRGGGK